MVLNDAGIPLSDGMKEALTRGLSFVPSSPLDVARRADDLEALRRSINLRLHWGTVGTETRLTSLISRFLKSSWSPPDIITASCPQWTTADVVPVETPDRTTHGNLSAAARAGWKSLLRNPDIYVTKADKGGKTVIIRRSDYRAAAFDYLDDQSTNEELTKEAADAGYAELHARKEKVIRDLLSSGCITSAEAGRLRAEQTNIPAMYFLLKVHKERKPSTGTFAGRPIEAAFSGTMKSLDIYLAKLTSPLLRVIPGSLMDTGQLIREISSLPPLPPGAQLYSADVEGLYPSIPWDEGIAAATWFYAKHFHLVCKWSDEQGFLPPPNPRIFKEILTLILKQNFFHFQETRWFRQLRGTAMGCSMSVFLANTFMYRRMALLHSSPPPGLLYLARYIDDIVAVYSGSPDTFTALFEDVVDESIRFTYVFGNNTLVALDLRLTLEPDGSISTRLYRKPTDGAQFVHWTSAHPEGLKASIPYAQLLRVKRNDTYPEDYEVDATALLQMFRDRGYPENVLASARTKADQVERASLLRTGSREDPADRITAVIDFDPETDATTRRGLRDLYERVLSAPAVTERQEVYGQLLPADPIRTATRVGRSLGSMTGPIFKRGPRS